MSVHLTREFEIQFDAYDRDTQTEVFQPFFKEWDIADHGATVASPLFPDIHCTVWHGRRFNLRRETPVFMLISEQDPEYEIDHEITPYIGAVTMESVMGSLNPIEVCADAARYRCYEESKTLVFMIKALQAYIGPTPGRHQNLALPAASAASATATAGETAAT